MKGALLEWRRNFTATVDSSVRGHELLVVSTGVSDVGLTLAFAVASLSRPPDRSKAHRRRGSIDSSSSFRRRADDSKSGGGLQASDPANELLYVSVVAGAVIMVDLRPRNVINVGKVKLLLICS